MLRPALGDLVLRRALPGPDPQLPEAVVEDRLTASSAASGAAVCTARASGLDTSQSTGARARTSATAAAARTHRLDALLEPTHRPALAVRSRAAVADQVDACHRLPLSVTQACSATTNGKAG